MESGKSGRWLWGDRWACLAAAMLMQAGGGLGYTFAVYSQHIKEKLDYDQEDLDTLGAAKDFGYCFGILGGILYNFLPPWLTILFGASAHFLGYFMVWMTTTGKVEPPFWMLCGFIAVGVGGDSWIDTAAIMTSLQNFDQFRGTVMGVLKAQVGLCGAIFVTLYKAFLKPNVDGYILLVATAPAVTSYLLAVFISPFPSNDEEDANDPTINTRFNIGYGATILLGLYLLSSIFIQTWTDVSRGWLVFFAVTMLLNLVLITVLLVLYKPIRKLLDGWSGGKHQFINTHEMVILPRIKKKLSDVGMEESTLEDDNQPLKGKVQDSQEDLNAPGDRQVYVTSKIVVHKKGYHAIERLPEEDDLKENNLVKGDEPAVQMHEIEHLTLWQNVRSLNFWLLCLVAMTGPGSGLAIINNFGQMGRSLESEKVELFVGLISVASCFGRLAAGYGSDLMLKRTGYPRPLCFTLAHLIMTVGCLTLAAGFVPLLYVGSVLVGGSYGAFWALTPAIISEVFGLHNFAALYKFIGACGPVGAYILSARLVGYLYDEEADRYQSLNPQLPPNDGEEENFCLGRQCFEVSMLVLATVCLLGATLGTILASRTTKLYTRSKIATTPS